MSLLNETGKWIALHPGQGQKDWRIIELNLPLTLGRKCIAGGTCVNCPFVDPTAYKKGIRCSFYGKKITKSNLEDARPDYCKLIEVEIWEEKEKWNTKIGWDVT